MHILADWSRAAGIWDFIYAILDTIPYPNYLQIAPIVNQNVRKLPKKSKFWKRYYPSEIIRERKIEALNITETDKRSGYWGVGSTPEIHRKRVTLGFSEPLS